MRQPITPAPEDAESPTLIVPFCPPAEMITCWPLPWSVLMSASNWASVYPGSWLDRPESKVKVTPAGLVASMSAKDTAMML